MKDPVAAPRPRSTFRPVRSIGGLLAGFLLAFGAIQAVGAAGERLAEREPEVVAELDVVAYCRAVGGEQVNATLLGDDADGWRCTGRRNRVWVVDPIDTDEACRVLHGDDTRASTDRPDSPHHWVCVRDDRA